MTFLGRARQSPARRFEPARRPRAQSDAPYQPSAIRSFGYTLLVYVLAYAPDLFPKRDWRFPEKQMNLERTFVGLRYGMTLFPAEKQQGDLVWKFRDLIKRGYVEYCSGRDLDGQRLLEAVEELLRRN